MRSMVRVSLALLLTLGVSVSAFAQTGEGRLRLNASVGPSFGNVGTTISTRAGVGVALTDTLDVVGEFGVLPHAPFREAAAIAPPAAAADSHVNAYHWNGNVVVRPFELDRIAPYATVGLGSFTADTVIGSTRLNGVTVEDRRRATNIASNVGAGMTYRLNDWLGIGGDYRTFFVYRDTVTPRVHRFTAGVSLFLK